MKLENIEKFLSRIEELMGSLARTREEIRDFVAKAVREAGKSISYPEGVTAKDVFKGSDIDAFLVDVQPVDGDYPMPALVFGLDVLPEDGSVIVKAIPFKGDPGKEPVVESYPLDNVVNTEEILSFISLFA